MKSEYKIKRLAELKKAQREAAKEEVEAKKAEQEPTAAKVQRSTDEVSSDTHQAVLRPFGSRIPPRPQPPRPESLRGLHILEVHCLYTDGLMTESEQRWYQSKCMTKHLMIYPQNWML